MWGVLNVVVWKCVCIFEMRKITVNVSFTFVQTASCLRSWRRMQQVQFWQRSSRGGESLGEFESSDMIWVGTFPNNLIFQLNLYSFVLKRGNNSFLIDKQFLLQVKKKKTLQKLLYKANAHLSKLLGRIPISSLKPHCETFQIMCC